jgi:hypothetical protein
VLAGLGVRAVEGVVANNGQGVMDKVKSTMR